MTDERRARSSVNSSGYPWRPRLSVDCSACMEQSATRDSDLFLTFDIPEGDQVSPFSSVIWLTWRRLLWRSADVCVELCNSFRSRFCKVPPQLCDGSIVIYDICSSSSSSSGGAYGILRTNILIVVFLKCLLREFLNSSLQYCSILMAWRYFGVCHSCNIVYTHASWWPWGQDWHVIRASWFRGSAVERWSLTSELLLSCARPTADGWPLMWVNRPL